MKTYNYIICIGMLLLASCNKELLVSDAPDFDVTVESASYAVGEEVVFRLSGHADMISFYSGQIGSDYEFRDGRVVELSDQGAVLSFSSAVTGGAQANQLSVLVSTNFDGNYESLASVKTATWTEITNRFSYGTNETFAASGNIDISDLVVPGSPLYVAFKYLTRPQLENGLARTWMIQSFVLASTYQFNGASLTFSDQALAGFRIVDEDPVNAPARSQVTTSRITLLGNVYKDPNDPVFDPDNPIYDPENPIYDPLSPQYDPNAVLPVYVPYDPDSPYNDPLRENWAVSRAFYTNSVDLGPDRPVGIRGRRNESLTVYQHVYSQPGTYKAYFVASNNTIDDEKTLVKEVTVTIVP